MDHHLPVSPKDNSSSSYPFGKEKYRVNAEDSANRFMNGETEEIHQVILAGQRAEIAFETFLQVRNKAVQAYQEVMRMQM